MAESVSPIVELALTLGKMVHTVSLLAGLALALSSVNCKSRTRSKHSRQSGSEIRTAESSPE